MNIIYKVLIVLAAIGIGLGSRYYFAPDNPIEQCAERVIEETVGVDVDLSPSYELQRDMILTSPSSQ